MEIDAKGEAGWTALMHAARNGHTEIVKALLENGADVNAKSQDDWTAIRMAVGEGHADVVHLLREAGAI